MTMKIDIEEDNLTEVTGEVPLEELDDIGYAEAIENEYPETINDIEDELYEFGDESFSSLENN
jgi:hypothetical protein